jgi:hypothetical protein
MASILRVDTLTDASSNNSTAMSTINQGTAKAWANCNQATVDDSFNIASVTDSSAGRFVVNIANDMANTGYAISVCARIPSGNVGVAVEDNGVARAAGTTPVYILNAGSYYDSTDTQVIINGDLA